ncbi:cell division protein FtsH [Longimonas halophila]|uniref:ATP-dependent zinc metalloprotease FtsH n=1 Tax=Longimonas halophila TaxID=1469170 RepID=A0A2H3NQ58_9BACT|nr:cell division protein FtsH [Longimonas halophila]
MAEQDASPPRNTSRDQSDADRSDQGKSPNKKRKSDDEGGSPLGSVVFIVAIGLGLLLAWSYFGGGRAAGPEISYSEFRTQLRANNVERVEVVGDEMSGALKESAMRATAQGDSTQYQEFVTYMPSFGDDRLMEEMEEAGVEVVAQPESDFPWGLVIIGLLPIVILLIIGYIFLRRMQSQGQGLFSVRKSKAKLFDKGEEDTTFDDVAGADGAKEELEEIIKFLKNPEHFENLGGKVPKGVLMVGPPGTGKTLLARAVAGEADVPFFSVSGSDFMEMFVGVGASRVRDMFEEAKKNAPAIIFVDELDSIGRQRGAGVGGGHDEREQTLNQLLAELDGFEKSESVVVMAATNRPDILDSALTRPGRFDRQITVPLPTREARREILKIHAKNKPFDDDVDLDTIASSTPGFSGADLENLLNESALLAGRYGRDAITNADIEEARDKVIMGLRREGVVLDEEERRLLAYHEAGHAIVAAALPHADPVHKVTIVPRGQAMGVTQQMPEKEKYLYRREYLLDRMAVVMGGRAAEEMIFDTATSGAENDLKQVRKMARKMVLDWGMGERFKHIALGDEQDNVFLGEELSRGRDYSDETAREVDDEVRQITENAFRRAVDTLGEHRDAFDKLADLLIEREEVPGKDVLALLNGDAITNNGAANVADEVSVSGAEAAGDEMSSDTEGDGATPDAVPASNGTSDASETDEADTGESSNPKGS